ncbi:hypothetical protein A3F60_02410 [Candidatus Roizmanbacteria bacterium RIFCSPHIGHO2_12_FULL_39_8]|uniref:Uncharacterized protein n=1 Tax=Candidatus Roizmanbacteria bacterium RIFCSPHIGHO2_12_FULL_39_8 TaxID=1802050 RepID=A0A1F7HZY2_9BACT|nr:MAG: hypothetical protein A3F60_02410 [Candidatus Roizmanbacteria bacterium RIFCSPHIGHO2_12_FULL_39_8]
MRKDILSYCTVIGIVLITTFFFWFPFLFRFQSWFGLDIPNSNFLYIYRHYDGLLYVVAAKTLYVTKLISTFPIDIGFDPKYFAAHLPLYPLLIRFFAPIFNYAQAMVFVNIISSIVLAVFFFYMSKKFKLTKYPLLLTSVFLLLPRFLIVRSIGSPESLFLLFILLSLFFFEKEKYLLAGLLGGLATMTKTPGILLFGAYVLFFTEKLFFRNAKFKIKWLFVLLIPLALLPVFWLYQVQYNDFFAYFHSGDNLHLVAPYAVFNSMSRWVGSAWLEDIIFYFFLYLLAVIYLKDAKYRSFFYFSLVFFIATIFIQHRDIGRYSLPLWPLACIGFEKFFTAKKFLLALVILLPAIYMYAWNFSLQNVMPVSDWTAFFSKF